MIILTMMMMMMRNVVMMLNRQKDEDEKLSINWSWTRLSTNVGWQQNFSSICRIFTFKNYWIFILMCFAMVRCHQVGGEQCSPCWENMSRPNWYQIFDQLRVCGCCIKRLHTWFWDALNIVWRTASQKNNTGFGVGGGLRNIWLQQIWWVTSCLPPTGHYGLPAQICAKAFDRINWDALWQSLLEQGVSAHIVWILQLMYCGQTGEVKGTWGNSTVFPIKAGVRQGCVLSPRLFCSVLQWAMKDWRAWAEGNGWGIDFQDGYLYLIFGLLMSFWFSVKQLKGPHRC